MDRSLIGHLDRAFELAFFIHRHRRLALDVTVDAMARVEVLASVQEKRRYYRPVGRRLAGSSEPRRHRNRVSMTRPQLLQRLLYSASERYQRRQEAAGENPGEDDMTIRYIARLTRICLRRNSFHVAVGFGRMLFAYPTGEVLALVDLVTQDPDRLRGPDYLRARKKCLLGELRLRFGAMLKPRRAQRGEQRFEIRETDGELRRLVARCLELMTPWQTRCVVPEGLRPAGQELEALSFRGAHPDDEHPIEMNRIHALVHPDCLSRLTRALALAAPEERLEVPVLSQGHGTDGGDPPPPDRDRPPRLGESDRRSVRDELGRRRDRRRRAAAGMLRVLVDGAEAAVWHAERCRSFELTVGDEAELIEVVAREPEEDVVLAAHLLPDLGEAAEPRRPRRASVGLRGGRRFDFAVTRAACGEMAGVRVEITFRESLPARVRACLRWRPAAGVGTRQLSWRPVAALALTVVAAFGSSLLNSPDPFVVPPRVRGPGVAAAALAEVERLFVDPLGAEAFAAELAASLARRLAARGDLAVVAERGEADAVVMRDPAGEGGGRRPSRIALRLVNARGEVLWRGVYRIHAGRGHAYPEAPGVVAGRVAADLDQAIRRAARRPQEP